MPCDTNPDSGLRTISPSWSDRRDKAVPKISVPRPRTPLDSRDLRRLRMMLLARPFVGLGVFAAMAGLEWWFAAPVVLWFHYGSVATAVHHLIHSGLGLDPKARARWLTALGLLIGETGHGWQTTHLLHHRDGSDLPDPEGYIEYLSWAQLPVGALKWRFRMARWGLKHSVRRSRVRAEVGAVVVLTVLGVVLAPVSPVLFIYMAMMQVGTFLFAVLLAKGPHANFGRPSSTPLMFVHTRLLGLVLFNHHLHLEHHAYPKVPMARLRELRPIVEQALSHEPVVHIHLAA